MQFNAAKRDTRQEYFVLYHNKFHRFLVKAVLAVVCFPNSKEEVDVCI